jgi:tetratricopeptide (TPR) repeat protein
MMDFIWQAMNEKTRLKTWQRFSLTLSCTLTAILSFGNLPAWAEDPFRVENPRDIGDLTETAFKTIFLQGDYQSVREQLNLAEQEEEKEPLVYALQASVAYTDSDWEKIEQYAAKTLKTSLALSYEDPVRGNLYLAVGHFLEGAYIYEKEGAVAAINKLQLVFKHLDLAEDNDPTDPELNLIKGYIDLLLAVNLPFSSPEQAITRFKDYAAPDYLVDRGLAVAYRDLKQYDKALDFVDTALAIAPDNPELFYLKGQILRKIGKNQQKINVLEEALSHFDRAITQEKQLPSFVVESLNRERKQTQETIDEIKAGTASN